MIRIKDYDIIIEKLRQARLDSAFTKAQVAKKLKHPQSFVSKCSVIFLLLSDFFVYRNILIGWRYEGKVKICKSTNHAVVIY